MKKAVCVWSDWRAVCHSHVGDVLHLRLALQRGEAADAPLRIHARNPRAATQARGRARLRRLPGVPRSHHQPHKYDPPPAAPPPRSHYSPSSAGSPRPHLGFSKRLRSRSTEPRLGSAQGYTARSGAEVDVDAGLGLENHEPLTHGKRTSRIKIKKHGSATVSYSPLSVPLRSRILRESAVSQSQWRCSGAESQDELPLSLPVCVCAPLSPPTTPSLSLLFTLFLRCCQ